MHLFQFKHGRLEGSYNLLSKTMQFPLNFPDAIKLYDFISKRSPNVLLHSALIDADITFCFH